MADEKTGERVSPPPAAKNSLDSILRRGGSLAEIEASAPEFHRQTLSQLGVRGSDTGLGAATRPELIQRKDGVPQKVARELMRGDEVIDTVKKRRGIVLECARSDKRVRLVHEATGDMWMQDESKLKRK